MLGFDFGFLFSVFKNLVHAVVLLASLLSFATPSHGTSKDNRSEYFRIASELSKVG